MSTDTTTPTLDYCKGLVSKSIEPPKDILLKIDTDIQSGGKKKKTDKKNKTDKKKKADKKTPEKGKKSSKK